MIKGIQKQMVMVRLYDSAAFETAYFVLRDDFEKGRNTDIVAEANALAQGVFRDDKRRSRAHSPLPRPMRSSLLLFFSGLFVGALAACVLCLLIGRI